MALPSLVHSPQNWSDPSERGLNEGVRRSSSDGRRPPIANRGGREDSPHMALAGLRFPRKIGPNRPSGASTKEVAGARRTAAGRRWPGRQPWRPRGFTAHGPRRPMFSPQNWSEPSERGLDERVRRSSPDGRRPAVARPPTVAAERIHRPRPSPAYVFSRKYGHIRPKGASPEKFAGPRRTTAVGRWPDNSSAIWGGGREKSPHMAFVGL